MYSLVIRIEAEKQFAKLREKDQARIFRALRGICEDPFIGKQLKGDAVGLFSVRVWPYRIIYTIERRIVTVTVVSIGHRKDVYRKLRR